jgi:hypothetical protein
MDTMSLSNSEIYIYIYKRLGLTYGWDDMEYVLRQMDYVVIMIVKWMR